jgi:hypothetical protein
MHRKLLTDKLRARGWRGSVENLDFDLLTKCLYDLEHERRGGAEQSRLRSDIMVLSDRLGISAKALGHNVAPRPRTTPTRARRLKMIRILSAQGAVDPEFGPAAVATEARLEREARDRIAVFVTDDTGGEGNET